ELGNVVLKAGPRGELIRLRDIARVELGAKRDNLGVRFNGRPAVALAIHPLSPDTDAKTLDSAVHALVDRLRGELPEGLAMDFAFEFMPNKAPDTLLVDVELPSGASTERTQKVLEQCEAIIRAVPGTTTTLATTEDPFLAPRPRPCIL